MAGISSFLASIISGAQSPAGLTGLQMLLQNKMGKEAPYDAAEAESFAMKQFMADYPQFVTSMNAINPPMDRPFMIRKDGQNQMQPPALFSTRGHPGNMVEMMATGNPGQAITDRLAELVRGAETMPQPERPNAGSIGRLLGGFF